MKKVECYLCLYLLQAGGQCGCWQGSCGSGSCSQVELGVISIGMVGYPMLADDPAQGKQIEIEKGGAQHWGTPQMTLWVSDLALPRATCSVLSVRYEVNQLRTLSESPMVCCRRWRRML